MRKTLLLAFSPAVFLAFFMSSANAQVISYFEHHVDGSGGVDGINGAYGIVVSPDDKHVYTASSTDDAVAMFRGNSGTGSLMYGTAYFDDDAGGSIHGLRDAKRLAIAPDGNHVYIPASNDDAIVVMSRSSVSGALTYVETVQDGIGGVNGLDGAHEVIVSPDNKHVYAVGYTDDMVAVFSRNTTTGELTFVEVQVDGASGVDGLNNPRGLVLDDSGTHLYVASATDDAVAVFSRNSTSGELTYIECHKYGVAGVDGMNGAYGIDISPDGKTVYIASYNSDAVAVFSRNTTNGQLTYQESHLDDSQLGGTIPSLNSARHVVVSDDNKYVYAISSSDHAVTVFERNTTTGLLTFSEEHVDGAGGVDGLNAGRYMAKSADDIHLYTVSTGDDALTGLEDVATLPVEMVSFTAELVEDRRVELNWVTETEINNDYFTVERSADGRNFQGIAEVLGAGSTNGRSDYQTYDESPLERINYYRLKQTDFDGQFEYSPIVAVEIPFSAIGPEKAFEVYPNPATESDEVYLRLEGLEQQEVLVVVQDVFGRQLYSKVLVTESFGSQNVFAVDPNNRLSPGTYIITGSADDTLFSKRLVVK